MKFHRFSLIFALSSTTITFAAPQRPLVVAWDVMPRTYDPRYAVDANSQYLEGLLHCSLIEFDRDAQLVKSVAKEWKWLSPTELELTLRDDVRFGDGSLLTSEDVKATYDFFLNEKSPQPSPRSTSFKKIKAITAAPNKITFALREPDPAFVANLAVGILPRLLASGKMLTPELSGKGCGPFNLETAEISSIKLHANPHYRLAAPAKTSAIEIKAVKDENTCFLKLQKGEVDITQNNISLDKITSIATKYPQLKVQHRPGLKTTYLGFNFQDPLVSKKAVRQAISYAIDRAAIIKYLLKEMAIPATTILLPSDSFYNKALPPAEYDPKKARALLDEAGLKPGADGTRFRLSYKITSNATRLAVAKTIASNLLEIGIKVEVQGLDWGKFKMDVDKGNVQMWSLDWVGFKDPDIYHYVFATANFPPQGANRGRFSHALLDQVLGKAQATLDPVVRRELFQQVQTIVHEEAPYVFLYHEENVALMQKNISDYHVYADGRYSSLVTAFRQL
jgi:peptide/nickel transport system substrate-binding protein